MPQFLVDENLPRSLAARLNAAGLVAQDVRDLGFRGAPDEEIFDFARSQRLILLTADLGFGALMRAYPDAPGAVLVRVPNDWPTAAVNELIEKSLLRLPEIVPGSLVVIEPERVRIRLV